MEYNTIRTLVSNGCVTVKLNRLEQKNSINEELLTELHAVLDAAEADPACRMIVLEGQNGIFSTGMDFAEVVASDPERDLAEGNPMTVLYMKTLKRFAATKLIVISKVDGTVMAGGVGLAAASDLVIATPRSQFSLSEGLWGLLPAMVIPYLIRRVGFQVAYRMTLTTLPLTAEEALAAHLVDEVSEDPDRAIRKLRQRLDRIEPATIFNMKQYFRGVWMITDEMEQGAVSEISRLVSLPEVKDNIHNFLVHQRFPWEK